MNKDMTKVAVVLPNHMEPAFELAADCGSQ